LDLIPPVAGGVPPPTTCFLRCSAELIGLETRLHDGWSTARHGTAVSSRTRAGPFGLLALQATSHGTNNESTSRGVLCPLLCWARPFSAISSVRVRCRSHCLFRICAEQRTRRVPFEGRLWAKARARTPAEGRPPRWKERAQCDGAP
jgi:hypothetical protein